MTKIEPTDEAIAKDPWPYFDSTVGFRDEVFQDVLKMLPARPKICEVGSAIRLSKRCRIGDGWSTFHFARHVKHYNGRLVLLESNTGGLSHLVKHIEPVVGESRLKFESDSETIKRTLAEHMFDLVYLDGPEDADLTYEWFGLIKSGLVLVDDMATKGSVLEKNAEPIRTYRPENDYRGYHLMALYQKYNRNQD